MAGSALASILIPIAALAALACWILMVFYADSHPAHGSGNDSLDSGDYDTGMQGPYLTKPELRLPRQERRRPDEAPATSGSERVPAQRRAEQGEPAQRETAQRQG
jgi:hypothetical protein